jgi:hypothetical protein
MSTGSRSSYVNHFSSYGKQKVEFSALCHGRKTCRSYVQVKKFGMSRRDTPWGSAVAHLGVAWPSRCPAWLMSVAMVRFCQLVFACWHLRLALYAELAFAQRADNRMWELLGPWEIPVAPCPLMPKLVLGGCVGNVQGRPFRAFGVPYVGVPGAVRLPG